MNSSNGGSLPIILLISLCRLPISGFPYIFVFHNCKNRPQHIVFEPKFLSSQDQLSLMSEAHFLRSTHSRELYPKAHRVSNMDFELHPTVSLKERSFNVLVAPREHFIAMLNRNLNLQPSRFTGNYSASSAATSKFHGA